MTAWVDELETLAAAGENVVAVTVAGVRGSAPRETGAKMFVTDKETIGTIGGGQLEYECTRRAARMLDGDTHSVLESFPLGASMGQCCGGVVDVLFESIDGNAEWLRDLAAAHSARLPAALVTDLTGTGKKGIVTLRDASAMAQVPEVVITAARARIEGRGEAAVEHGWFLEPLLESDFDIAVFGAGHVGSAVVATLAGLDCNLRWVDSRRDVFGPVPANVRTIETADPAREVAALRPGAYVLIMTHSHPIDLEITHAVLERGDIAYCGLIGSRSKRRRFEKRLVAAGLPASCLDDLRCPIGVDGITGKKPAEIAIAVAAELLKKREARDAKALPVNVHRLGKA